MLRLATFSRRVGEDGQTRKKGDGAFLLKYLSQKGYCQKCTVMDPGADSVSHHGQSGPDVVFSSSTCLCSQQDEAQHQAGLGRSVQLLAVERVAYGRRKALAPRLLVQQHQVLHVPPSVPPSADLHCDLPPLKDFQGLFGSHGLGGGLVPSVPGAHVHSLAADLAHVTIPLCSACGEARDVLQRHKHTGQGLFARLYAATQDFKMVQVGPEAAGRHQLPGHRLVEAVEEGLVLGRGLRRRSALLSRRPWIHLPRRPTLSLVRLASAFFHAAVAMAL